MTYILIINEALYYGNKLDHSLINSNQIRANSINVHDNPFDIKPISIDMGDGLIIPLIKSVTKIYFDSRTPMEKELNNCQHIHLMSINEWNPESVILGEMKTQRVQVRQIKAVKLMTDGINPYSFAEESKYYYNDYRDYDMTLIDIDPNYIMLKERLIEKVLTDRYANHDNTESMTAQRSYTSKGRHKQVTSLQLAEDWCIGYRRAEATMKATTQNATRSAILPTNQPKVSS